MTAIEVTNLQQRVAALEDYINYLQGALIKMVTLEQAEQLGLLNQNDIEELKVRATGLEARVATLESYHRT